MQIPPPYLLEWLAHGHGFGLILATLTGAYIGIGKPMAIVVAVLALLAGVVMLQRGWWPKRVGPTRFCRRCRYNLTGTRSATCPECGAALDESSTIIGERRRRPVLVGIGLLVLLVVVGSFIAVFMADAKQINWYRYRPTAWVINDTTSTIPRTANRAWFEIDRRQLDNSLSERRLQQLTEASLKVHAQTNRSPTFSRCFDFLAQRWLANLLSPNHRDRLARNIARLDLKIRPRNLPGDPILFRISQEGHLSCGPVRLDHSTYKLLCRR